MQIITQISNLKHPLRLLTCLSNSMNQFGISISNHSKHHISLKYEQFVKKINVNTIHKISDVNKMYAISIYKHFVLVFGNSAFMISEQPQT